jgi:hypothetical protein
LKSQIQTGDHVDVVVPGIHRDRRGLIAEILQHAGDFVYRYRVRFADGASELFFGFELTLIEAP